MSSVRYEFPKSRLAQQLREAGGMAVEDALAAVEANLVELRPEAVLTLQSAAAEAVATFQRFPAAFDPKPLQQLYGLSARAVGCGAVSDAPAADVALVSLCELLDHFVNSGVWDLQAIGVHVHTLQLLAQSAGGPSDAVSVEKVLDGLRKVSARYAIPKTAEPRSGVA